MNRPILAGACAPSLVLVAVLGSSIPAGPVSAASIEDARDRQLVIEKLTGGATFLNPITPPGPDAFGGHCIIWNDVAYLMAPSVSPLQVDRFVEGLPTLTDRRYQFSGSYWTNTATNGNVSVPGERITLTWSFVPDGTIILGGGTGAPTQQSTLYNVMTTGFGSESGWQSRYRQAFTDIGNLIGVNYVEVSDDGASQPSAGLLGARGDIRIGMIAIDGPEGVLAFNYFPRSTFQSSPGLGGDMVFDSADINLFRNPANTYRRLRNTIMHEHGHGLGYAHVDPINQTKLMEATLNTDFTGLQEDDIRAFQSGYGDYLAVNSAPEVAAVLDPLPTTPGSAALVRQNLAIERDSAIDYFRFTAPALRGLSIRVEPIGSSYPAGPQDGATTVVHALSIHDLIIDVMNGNASEIIGTINNTGAGFSEEGVVSLPPAGGEFLFRIRSGSVSQQSQRYRLTVSLTPVDPPVSSTKESFSIY